MANLSKKQLLIVGAAAIVLVALVVLVATNLRKPTGGQKVTVVFAGPDEPQAWEGVIKEYGKLRPEVTVNYVAVPAANYKETILNMLASGRGPDVFYVGNRDLLAEAAKTVPADPAQFDASKLRELYPRVVEQDFVSDGKVAALPLYLDTMAMIYNRDIFDQAGVATIPETWNEFLEILPRLRVLGSDGRIARAAAAIGGSEKSVDAGTDLLNLLMLQNGTEMNNTEKTEAAFASAGASGFRAFDFYLQFANPESQYFTWTDDRENSVDAFAKGKIAAIFNYRSSTERIRRISPFLNFGVAPMLQASSGTATNYARYEGLAVARQSRVPRTSWDFVIYAATQESAAKSYSAATGRFPALRSIIAEESGGADAGVFARQALTARSWLEPSGAAVREAMNGAIEDVLAGREKSSAAALRRAEEEINKLYPKK